MSHIDQALSQHGFELVRTRKHRVYKRADGTTFVTPSTPSDVRWERHALADFARIVGKTKRELTSHALPKRARRRHSRLEPLPQPAILAPVAVADFPNPVPELSAQDRKLLKRLERYQANREKKRIAREKKLMPYITKAHQMYLAEYETVPHVQFKIAQALAESLRRLSYDAEPVICGVVGESSVTDLLVLSQVVLALQLPFAMFPLLQFTSSRKRMGAWKNGWFLLIAGWGSAILICAIDVYGLPESMRAAWQVVTGR